MSAIQRAELLLSPVCGVSSQKAFVHPDSIAAAIGEVDVCSSLPYPLSRLPGFLASFSVAAYGTFFMLQPGFRGSRFLVRYPLKRVGRLHSVSRRTHRYSNGCLFSSKCQPVPSGGMRRFINLAIFLPANFADCFLRTGSCAALMCRIFVYSVTTWIYTPSNAHDRRKTTQSPLMYVAICSDYFSARRYRRWRLYPCISSREISNFPSQL